MPLWFRVLRIWLPISIAFTAACGLAYLGVQQSYRNGLDDPQLQLATDGAAALDAGASAASVATSPDVDVTRRLAPFVTVYAADGSAIAAGGLIGDSVLSPANGVLAATRAKGTDRVTLQPAPGLRVAAVSVAAKDGRVVLAGRNMRAVEARIDQLTAMTGVAWALGVIAVLVACVVVEFLGLRFSAS